MESSPIPVFHPAFFSNLLQPSPSPSRSSLHRRRLHQLKDVAAHTTRPINLSFSLREFFSLPLYTLISLSHWFAYAFLLSWRRKAAEDVNLASIKHRELEKDSEEACVAEDLEKAERVRESLVAAEKEKQAFLIALRDAEAEANAIDSQMHEVLKAQIAAEEQGILLLNHFAKDVANNANLDELFTQEEEKSAKLREFVRVSVEEARAYREVIGLRKLLMESILKSQEDKLRLVKTDDKLSEEGYGCCKREFIAAREGERQREEEADSGKLE